MTPDQENEFMQMKQEIAELKNTVEVLSKMRVDEASGGGQLIVSDGSAVIRVNSLTASGGQLP